MPKLLPKYQEEMNTRIKNAETMREILDILSEYYDLENSRPGAIVKGSILIGLNKVITITRSQPKKFYSDGN